jgi:hypothetical protein
MAGPRPAHFLLDNLPFALNLKPMVVAVRTAFP